MDEVSVPILLAEDSSTDVAIIQRSFRKGNIPNPVQVAHDGQAALDALREPTVRYGVLVLDIHLPKVGGLDVLKEAKRIDPDLVVIMLTGQASFHTAVQSLRHEGAFDYLEKSKDDLPRLVEAVRLALKHCGLRRQNRWDVPTQGGERRSIDMAEVKARFNLSDRELDVVKCLCRGDTNKHIGERLFISDLTVKGHLKHIYEKMKVHTRSAVVSAVLTGLPPSPGSPSA